MTKPKTKEPRRPKYVRAQIDTIIQAFAPFQQLQSFVTWTPTLNAKKTKWLKRPDQETNKPDLHFTLAQAAELKKPIGVVCSAHNNIIAFDIDGLDPETNHAFKEFCETHPTYEEASPSGKPHRRRRIYFLVNKEDKQKLEPKPTCKYPNDAEISLFNQSGNYVTLTGAESNDHPISPISAEDITNTWPRFKRKKIDNTIEFPSPERVKTKITPARWLEAVPCAKSNPQVQQFMKIHDMDYNTYWLTGIMALHYTHTEGAGYYHAEAWSRTSDDFDIEELAARWKSLGSDEKYSQITTATYDWYYQAFVIDWPVKTGDPKNNNPLAGEWSNFEAFLDHYGLDIKVDGVTKTVYLDGPEAVVYPYYYGSKSEEYKLKDSGIFRLAGLMMQPMRLHRYRPKHKEIQEFIKIRAGMILPKDQKSRFAKEITRRPYDPEKDGDRLGMLAKDIIVRHRSAPISKELHASLVKKWCLSLGRTLWPDDIPQNHRGQSVEGMLILQSNRGGIGKSTWAKKLLPEDWEHLYVAVKPRLSGMNEDKDYKMKIAGALIVDHDEFERVLKLNNEADVKSEGTTTQINVRLPYSPDMLTFERRYSTTASTNLRDLPFPREGSRRFWWLEVSDIDLDALDEWDRYILWSQIRHELINARGKEAPWLLTEPERKELIAALMGHTTENNWEILLNEHFDFSAEGYADQDKWFNEQLDKGLFEITSNKPAVWYGTMGLKDVGQEIGARGEAGLKRALVRLVQQHAPKKYYIKKSFIPDGIFDFRGQKKYLLPIRRPIN